MPSTLFYSWQSDLPNNLNRGLIRRAIDDAVAKLNKDVGVEDAIRVDQDTQDEPGTPTITDTILRKIEECSVFVPDVSFVVGGAEGRPSPNPNVMIEHGYALSVCGDRRFVPVFNTAFGNWEDLPFDMRHKRRPILYKATEDLGEDERREVRQALSREILGALEVMAGAGLLETTGVAAKARSPWIQKGVDSIITDKIIVTISPIDISRAELSYDPSGEIEGHIISPTEIQFLRRQHYGWNVSQGTGGEIVITWTVKDWGNGFNNGTRQIPKPCRSANSLSMASTCDPISV